MGNEQFVKNLLGSWYVANAVASGLPGSSVFLPRTREDAEGQGWTFFDEGSPEGPVRLENHSGNMELKVLQQKTSARSLDYESFDGAQTISLVDIEGEKFVFDDGYSSWGDTDPSSYTPIKEIEKKVVYVYGQNYFDAD